MLEDTYGHSPIRKMFDLADVYGVGYDEDARGAEAAAAGNHRRRRRDGVEILSRLKRLQTIWEPVDVTAFSRRDQRAGRHIEATWGGRWYRDYAEMLDKETFDGVMVLGPNHLHAEHGIACIERGLPILVEKPFTLSLSDGQRLCRLADERGVPVMTVANKRFSPPYRRAKRFVDEGPVNNPAMYAAKFNLGYDYVIHMLEAGTIHVFDLTRYFMGDVARLHAVGVNKYGRNQGKYPFDNAMISFEFASGSVGQLYTSCTAVSLKPWERVEVYGDKAWLAVEDQYELRLYDSEEGPAKSWRPVRAQHAAVRRGIRRLHGADRKLPPGDPRPGQAAGDRLGRPPRLRAGRGHAAVAPSPRGGVAAPGPGCRRRRARQRGAILGGLIARTTSREHCRRH